MKKIIDENGEIVEVPEANELAESKLYEVGVLNDQVLDMIEQYLMYEQRFNWFKTELQKVFEENGIKAWKTDEYEFILREESVQKRVDTDRLKEDGLYNQYLKLVPVRSSLQFRQKRRSDK